MHHTARSIFFWTLVAVFVATTPAIVFFLMGYRYSTERGVFVYTGSLSIQANPSDNLSITIDGKPASSEISRINGSYHIEGLEPGRHVASIAADGFFTWSKEFTVRSGIATEFWNVLLPRETPVRVPVSAPEGTRAFFPSSDGRRTLFLSERNGETLATIFEERDASFRQVFSSRDLIFDPASTTAGVLWDPDNSSRFLLSLRAKTADSVERFFIIDTETLTTIDLKDIAGTDQLRSVRWNPSDQSGLLFLSGTDLFSITLFSLSTPVRLSSAIENYDLSAESVIALEARTGIIIGFPIDDPSQREQFTVAPADGFPSDREGEMVQKNPFLVVAYDRTRIAIERPGIPGDLFLFVRGDTETTFSHVASSGIHGIQFSDDGKKLLTWTGYEILVIYTRAWESQPFRTEGERVEVGRFSTPIRDVQWAKDYEHVLFTVGNETKVAELDDRGGRNIATILTTTGEPLSLKSFGNRNILFVLDPSGDPPFFSITFPEPTGLFGFRSQK